MTKQFELPLLDNMEEIKERLEKFLGDTSYNGIFAQGVVEKGYLFDGGGQ